MKTKPINLKDLLEEVEQALDDWIILDCPEGCKRHQVVAAWKRISDGGGTLAFVTDLRERVSKAIEQLEKAGSKDLSMVGMCNCGAYEVLYKLHTTCPDCAKPWRVMTWRQALSYLHDCLETVDTDRRYWRNKAEEAD